MGNDESKGFFTLPHIGPATEKEVEAFIDEEASFVAHKRRQAADGLLRSRGFKPFDKNRPEPLNRVAALLGKLGMLDECGSVLISAEATLRQSDRSDIYFLGLNPGGDTSQDIFGGFPTVYESLALSRMGVSGWDQDWSRKGASFEAGHAPIQSRFKHIASFLGLSYGEILATNLVFARSRRFKVLPQLEDQIEACLPVHEVMMEIVRPSRLWVMGNTDSAGGALKVHSDVEWRSAKHANWSIGRGTVEFCGRTLTLCHTPHLSLWDATAEDKQELLEFAFG
jgi:hypothetical protein